MTTDTENYFSISDILATQERIPCKVELPIYRLGPLVFNFSTDILNQSIFKKNIRKGYLDTSAEGDDLVPGTKMELPYWMARALCSHKRHIVSVELPKPYRESYREILNADATVVDLHKLGPHYYSFGTHLLRFELPDTPDISKSILKAYQSRLRKIMDLSQNCYNEDTSKLTEKLDEVERSLFKSGQKGLNDFQRWETRQIEKLTTSEMVRNHRKRKRAVDES